jgi:ABC-type polysaccharide/polyol phosphate export permease
MYIELSSGVIRFSMLDTSIRTREVYVMGQERIIQKYNRSLGTTPLIAGFVALITLLINVIIPAIIGIFDQVSSNRLSESVELTSVYGVALGTAMVFGLIAISFSVNLPARIQKFQEGRAE